MRRRIALVIAVSCALGVAPGCSDDRRGGGDGGPDEEAWLEPMELGDVLDTSTAVLMLGATTGGAYAMRVGASENHVLVMPSEYSADLFGVVIEGEREGGLTLEIAGCVYRDGDGVEAGQSAGTGTVSFSGQTSARDSEWSADFYGAAQSLGSAVAAQSPIDAADLEAWIGLQSLAHIEVDVTCEGTGGDNEYDFSMDAIAVPGTEDEVDAWWGELGALIPSA
ncbi:MAG: hypothetical protein M0R80_27205 [Proteobacteria bacterium]|nr:hypothetical protein [Pseudomonadota bacterium]